MDRLFENESISSWIERQVFYQSLDGQTRNSLSLRKHLLGRISVDIDYYSPTHLQELISILYIVPIGLEESAVPPTEYYMLPSVYRTNFCQACVAEDLLLARTAVWRQAWSFGWCVVCEKHHCALFSLKKDYQYNHIGQRVEMACRSVVEASCNLTATDAAELDQVHARSTFDGSNLALIQETVIDLAEDIQGTIRQLTILKTQAASVELNLMLDLMSVILRRHKKGIDSTPYCFQLVKKLTGQVHAMSQPRNSSLTHTLSGVLEVTDNYPRMLALVMVAVLLRHPRAEVRWMKICNLFAEMGTWVPRDRKMLYSALAGEEGEGVKDWFLMRLRQYPVEFRKLCKEFCMFN